jgi:hypothetical protein
MEELKQDLESARRSAAGSGFTGSKVKAGVSRFRSPVLLALGAVVLLAVLLPMGRTRPAAPPGVSTAQFPSSPSSTSPSSAIEDEFVVRGRELPAVPTETADIPADRSNAPLSSGAALAEPVPKLSPVSGSGPPGPSSSSAEPEEVPEGIDPISLPSTERPRGSLSITSNIWVEVRLDDGPPDETPVLLRGIPTGPHLLRVTRPGSPSRLLEVVVREGETTAVHLENELRR